MARPTGGRSKDLEERRLEAGQRRAEREPPTVPVQELKADIPQELAERPDAAKVWQELLPQLEESGLFGEQDRTTLVDFCLVSADLAEAYRAIPKDPIVRTGSGRRVLGPEWKRWETLFEMKKALAFDLGLSPYSRAKLVAERAKSRNKGGGSYYSQKPMKPQKPQKPASPGAG